MGTFLSFSLTTYYYLVVFTDVHSQTIISGQNSIVCEDCEYLHVLVVRLDLDKHTGLVYIA